MFTVLDVSRWQGRIDWDTVKASGRVHGVMLRTLGSRSSTPYIDPMFETNYSACTRLGIPVGVYYYSCAVTAPQRDAELAPFDLWLADYRGKRPARRHGMWQYTSRGRVPGISGPVDLSRTEKDYPALLHRAGLDRTIL